MVDFKLNRTNMPTIDSVMHRLEQSQTASQQQFFTDLGDFVLAWEESLPRMNSSENVGHVALRDPVSSSIDLTRLTQSLHNIATSLSTDVEVKQKMDDVLKAAKDAQEEIATLSSEQKNKGIRAMASKLRSDMFSILEANKKDVQKAVKIGITDAKLDRLTLSQQKVLDMAAALETIAQQEDPVHQVLDTFYPPMNNLTIDKISKPLGIIGIIYEARPNVTSDAAGICLKSSNPVILRPGSDCYETSKLIVDALQMGLFEAGLPKAAVQLVPTKSRDAVGLMLKARGTLDLIIPRGGLSLTKRVYDEALVPTLLHLDGNCHTYVDKNADEAKAIRIVINAKMRRTGICGATESLLIHKDRVSDLLPKIVASLKLNKCEIVGDHRAVTAGQGEIMPAGSEDFQTEFLGPKLSIQVVDSIEEAVEVINANSSKHTEAIISENQETQTLFLNRIQSAIVMVNTSTQFADGGEFGFGAEIGISTGSQAPRGPIGAKHLTSFAYQVQSDGAIRAGGNERYNTEGV